ncbi:hypothetical protein [Nocardia salmonicida]|uniref:hypothetical protein n=1 Tax=Nocardia salmonicida TaxID=53431 RepID=UPI002E27E37C|nr:hypothetical protein [Nocardia salmonicida]
MSAAVTARPPDTEDPTEDSIAAYMAMMRRVHEVSGFTAGQISVFSGLPRSTAYRFIDPKNTTLPKNRDQVESFLRACRMPSQQVVRMLNMWDELSGFPPQQPPHRDIDNNPDWRYEAALDQLVVSSNIESDDEPKKMWLTWKEDQEQWRQDNTPQFPHVPSLFECGQAHAAARPTSSPVATPVCCQECSEQEQWQAASRQWHDAASQRWRAGPQPRQRRGAGLVQVFFARVFPLAVVVIALYPMAAAVWFGYRFTGEFAGVLAVLVVMGLLFSTAGWVHKSSWEQLLTPLRIGIGMLAGVGAGVLAWFAVSIPLVGALTGLVVFSAAPVWINLTRLTGILTSTRGAFTLITATWCGIVLGYAASAAGFPGAGAILVAVMGTAMAVMLLSGSIFDGARTDTQR